MKSILFILPTIKNGGGTIRSLQNLLLQIPVNKYKIYVLPLSMDSSLSVNLKNVQILHKSTFFHSLFTSYKSYDFGFLYIILFLLILFRKSLNIVFGRKKVYNYFLKKYAQDISGYDTVIAFEEGLPTLFSQFIQCNNKIAWVHCDYSQYIKAKNDSELDVYEKYSKIVCVSKYTLSSFTKVYPQIASKCIYIYNILDERYIRNLAEEKTFEYLNDKSKYKIVSLGRIVPVKQFEQIPYIAKQLKCHNVPFVWYIVGDSDNLNYKQILESKISELDVADVVNLVGPLFNPYSFISHCDLLVSTSVSEACPYVIREADILNLPVLCNTFPSASEFINHGENGYLCPVSEMADFILKNLLDNNLSKKEVGSSTTLSINKKSMDKIFEIL